MSEATYTVEFTSKQIGMIQRALRLAFQNDIGYIPIVKDDPLDLEHLRTHIAQSVTTREATEQSGSKTSTP